jgi:hypothetical protein
VKDEIDNVENNGVFHSNRFILTQCKDFDPSNEGRTNSNIPEAEKRTGEEAAGTGDGTEDMHQKHAIEYRDSGVSCGAHSTPRRARGWTPAAAAVAVEWLHACRPLTTRRRRAVRWRQTSRKCARSARRIEDDCTATKTSKRELVGFRVDEGAWITQGLPNAFCEFG